MSGTVRRPLRPGEVALLSDLYRLVVWHTCGGPLLPCQDRPAFACGGCPQTWKLSTFQRFTEAELAARFTVEEAAPQDWTEHALVWRTEGQRRFLGLMLPFDADGMERWRP